MRLLCKVKVAKHRDNVSFVSWYSNTANRSENMDRALVYRPSSGVHCRCSLFIMLVSDRCNEGKTDHAVIHTSVVIGV